MLINFCRTSATAASLLLPNSQLRNFGTRDTTKLIINVPNPPNTPIFANAVVSKAPKDSVTPEKSFIKSRVTSNVGNSVIDSLTAAPSATEYCSLSSFKAKITAERTMLTIAAFTVSESSLSIII